MVLKLWFISTLLTSDCIIWEGPRAMSTKNKGTTIFSLADSVQISSGRHVVCGNSLPHTERRERIGSGAHFPFPRVGQHLLDNDGIRLQGHMPLWNTPPNSVAGYRKPHAPPCWMFKGCKRKTWGAQTSLERLNFSLGFLSFLVGTILGVWS